MQLRARNLIAMAAAAMLFVAVSCDAQAAIPDNPLPSPSTQEQTTPTSISSVQAPGSAQAGSRRNTPVPTLQSGESTEISHNELTPSASPQATQEGAPTLVWPTPGPELLITPPTPTRVPALADCGAGPVLAKPPMDDGTYTSITPLGNVAPPSHTFPTGHMYFSLPWIEIGQTGGLFGDGRDFPPQRVYAAADARIASLALADVISTDSGSGESYKEYDLRLEVCEGIQIRYGHIGPLSDRLEALMEDVEPNWCNSYSTGSLTVDRCEYSPNWEVVAGEFLAFTSGRAAAFDFGATRPLDQPGSRDPVIRVPECPLNLYDDAQREQFERLLGTSRVQRTTLPLCGVVDLDVPGTAQGRWHKQLGGFPVEDQNVAFVFDNIQPEVPVFSIGNSVPGVRSATYRFVPVDSGNFAPGGRVNRPFQAVKPGAGTFCYEQLTDRFDRPFSDLIFLLDMIDDSTILIEAVTSPSCGGVSWVFSDNAATYFR